MEQILFLDIDGVLRKKDTPFRKLDEESLERFEETLRSFPEVKIVITSIWRVAMTLAEFKKFFSPDIAERIIGVTPMSHYLEDHNRYKEVLSFLKEIENGSQKWIALEGDPDHFPTLNNVLLVDPDQGFDKVTAQHLSTLLNQQ
jgi:hypothetical protein